MPAEAADLPVGAKVVMNVDPALREIHARIHSAGHLIDLAVQRLSIYAEMQSMNGKQLKDITLQMVLMSSTKEQSLMPKR